MKKSSRNLLIVGCGDVARRALPILARRWRIVALVREFDPALRNAGVRQIVGDLDHPATLQRLAGIATSVLHSAPPPNTGDTDPRTSHLLASLTRRASLTRAPLRLVYISTSGIYGDCAGAHIDESRPPAPATSRARRRVAAETQLRRFGRRGHHVSLLRAPGIYAADRLPQERLRRGEPALVPAEDVFTNHIHADDLARACVAALTRARPNRAYNICDDSALRMGDWFDLLADSFALPRPPRMTRATITEHLSPALRSFMGESRQLDNTRMKRELKLRLAYPTVQAGLSAALQGNPSCSG